MTDKATPSPASVDSVMALADSFGTARWVVGAEENSGNRLEIEEADADAADAYNALRAEVERLAAQAAPSVDSWTREDVDEVISCLEDDSAALKNENEEDERAANMDRAGSMLAWMLLTHPVYRAQPSQAPVVQAVPENCSTGHCSCIECVVDADRASSGATTQAVRMLTREELNDVALSEQVGWGPGEYVEAVQLALLRVNAGRTIPADGVIGGAA